MRATRDVRSDIGRLPGVELIVYERVQPDTCFFTSHLNVPHVPGIFCHSQSPEENWLLLGIRPRLAAIYS
jgi:hypothetical protein